MCYDLKPGKHKEKGGLKEVKFVGTPEKMKKGKKPEKLGETKFLVK
jgi:hypothetical protein